MMTGLALSLWLAAVPPPDHPSALNPLLPCELLADFPTASDPRVAAELNLSTGLFSLHLDRDGDGSPDLVLVFQVLRTSDSLSDEPSWIEVLSMPAFLYLDRNGDGRWDELWVNRGAEAGCRTWELYSVIRPG